MASLVLLCAVHAAEAEPLDRAALVSLSTSVLKIEALRKQGGYSIGSGVAVGETRVVTNCHVTRDAEQVFVLRGDNRWRARAQRSDVDHDLCLLEVPGMEATVAKLGDAATPLRPGDDVIALGFTGGLGIQTSGGKVIALHRFDGGSVIQSTNWFNSGASGGGLFDARGALVGILTFRLRGGEAHYFAAPVAWVPPLIAQKGEAAPIAPIDPGTIAYWQRPIDGQPAFLQAAVLERDKNWQQLDLLSGLWLKDHADDVDPWYEQGLARAQLQRWPEARESLEKAVAIEPRYAAAWYRLGEVCLRMKQPERAQQALEALQALDDALAEMLAASIKQDKG